MNYDCSTFGLAIPNVFHVGISRPEEVFRAGPCCVQPLKSTMSPSVTIHRENTSATPGTVVENYFRFAFTTVKNGLNVLG